MAVSRMPWATLICVLICWTPLRTREVSAAGNLGRADRVIMVLPIGLCGHRGMHRRALRVRGGQPGGDDGADGCSAAVSDRGLLESVRDGDTDMSVLEEFREATLMRLNKLYDAEVRTMCENRKKGYEKQLQMDAEAKPPTLPAMNEIDYGAVVGIDVAKMREQMRQTGIPGGMRLRACDEALLQEEDELFEAAQRGDAPGAQDADGGDIYCGDARMQARQRRLVRIKSLLRCRAAAMTNEALSQQGIEGLEIPVHEMGTAKQREALRKMRDLYSSQDPSHELAQHPRAALAPLKQSVRENVSGVVPQKDTGDAHMKTITQSATAAGVEQNAAYGPLIPMDHPYLVIRLPNCATLLYEREQGDLDEGLRVEGVRRATPATLQDVSSTRGQKEWHETWVGPVPKEEGKEKVSVTSEQGKENTSATSSEGSSSRQECTWKVMNMTLQKELLEAAECGDYDGLVRAIKNGANLETGRDTPYRVSALHLASRGNHLGVMQLLLHYGQDANAQEQALATPLHYACDRGCLEAVQLLLYAGANPSSADCYGRTALHRAAIDAPRRVARLLIEAGADVHSRDLLLDSPLHLAAIWGNEGVARLMVAQGARGDDFNRFGHCPVVLADSWERPVVAKFLREHLCRIGAPVGYLSHLKPLCRPDELATTPGFDPSVFGLLRLSLAALSRLYSLSCAVLYLMFSLVCSYLIALFSLRVFLYFLRLRVPSCMACCNQQASR